ncbi:UNVERIFIED_CONTAM: hypothetical protein GTU68_034700, partial [Idotea baltica]|nr:hypothetical protein [Idotea baltica]
IFVVGPTATGKTELSLQLAEHLNWPIINCDSVQVYKNVNIGTAKPSLQEYQRATHYLFDFVEPAEKFTVAEYLKAVVECLKVNNIKNAIFVGGSGFYIQALEKGLYPESETPLKVQKDVDKWVTEDGMESLYQWMQANDPFFAKKISPNDHYRIRRAVEVMKTQNK